MLQSLVVGLIVGVCLVYAAWTLMPAVARRALARNLQRLLPPLARWRPIARAAQGVPQGCGCDGCDAGQPQQEVKTVRVVRRMR